MIDSDDRREPVTREALYELVWAEPMLKVADRYGVSSSYMARVCGQLNVPRPERGYWAKLAVGKALPKPALPDARPGDELAWSTDPAQAAPGRPLPRPPLKSAPRTRPVSAGTQPTQHSLIRGAKPLFEAGRLSYDTGYLKPAKKLLVDLVVAKTGLDKALSFGNRLFSALEENGYRVLIAPNSEPFRRPQVDERETPRKQRSYSNLWSPWRCTVVYIGTVAIGLTIIEMSEEVEVRYVDGKYVRLSEYVSPKRRHYAVDHSWTTKRDFPTGRICLQAYSPYRGTTWSHHWRETETQDLSSRISTIVKKLEAAAIEVSALVAQAEREAELERQRWELQQARWRREEEEKRAAAALKESKG